MSLDPHVPAPLLEHCPHCSGAVRPDASWCTQCWTDLRPPLAPEPPERPEPPDPPGPPGPPGPAETAEAAGQPEPSWPCGRCAAANPLELSACGDCGTPFLSAMRTDSAPLLVLPLVGDLTRLSRAQRYGLAGVVVLAVLALVALTGLLFS